MSELTALHRRRYQRQIVVVYAFLALITLGVIKVWQWMLWPAYPLTLSSPIKVVEVQHFGASNTIIYEMSYCKDKKYAEFAAQVYFVLKTHDGVSHPLPGAALGPLDFGCHTDKFALSIPLLKPDVFTLMMTRVYAVNPLKSITIQSESAEFIVPSPVLATVQVSDPITGKPKAPEPETKLKAK